MKAALAWMYELAAKVLALLACRKAALDCVLANVSVAAPLAAVACVVPSWKVIKPPEPELNVRLVVTSVLLDEKNCKEETLLK